MKVLLITTKAHSGGVQVFILNLARGLKASGHEVVVGAGAGDFLPTELNKLGVEFKYFKSLRRGNNPLLAWQFVTELKQFLKSNHFEVVHLNSSNALLGVAAIRGLQPKPRSVFTVHGLSVLDENYQLSFLKKSIYRYLFQHFLHLIDQVVFVSQLNFDQAKKNNLVTTGEVIYNGLDQDWINFQERDIARQFLSAKLGRDLTQEYLIGSIGRLTYQKNYGFLIANFSAVLKIKPRAKLIIIGSGEEEPALVSLIKQNKLNEQVFLINNLDQAAKYLKAFDLFVLPSRYEGLPLTLIEARLAGVPILASRVGGNEEVVSSPAELYHLDDQADFQNKLAALLNQPELREAILKSSAASLSQFSLKEMLDHYLKIYSR